MIVLVVSIAYVREVAETTSDDGMRYLVNGGEKALEVAIVEGTCYEMDEIGGDRQAGA